MQYQHHLFGLLMTEKLRDSPVRVSDVKGVVPEAPLDYTLDHIQDDAPGLVVDAIHQTPECQRQTIQTGPKPVTPGGDAIDEQPMFVVMTWPA